MGTERAAVGGLPEWFFPSTLVPQAQTPAGPSIVDPDLLGHRVCRADQVGERKLGLPRRKREREKKTLRRRGKTRSWEKEASRMVGLLGNAWDLRQLESSPLGPRQTWRWQWVLGRTPLSCSLSCPRSRLQPGPHTATSLPRPAWALGRPLLRPWFVLE